MVSGFLGGESVADSGASDLVWHLSSSPCKASDFWSLSDLLRSADFLVFVSLPLRLWIWRLLLLVIFISLLFFVFAGCCVLLLLDREASYLAFCSSLFRKPEGVWLCMI